MCFLFISNQTFSLSLIRHMSYTLSSDMLSQLSLVLRSVGKSRIFVQGHSAVECWGNITVVSEEKFKYMFYGLFWTSLTIFPFPQTRRFILRQTHKSAQMSQRLCGKLLPYASKTCLVSILSLACADLICFWQQTCTLCTYTRDMFASLFLSFVRH